MGTISEKLTYLNETKQLLKDKINNLGGSIDEHTTFRQYANQLQNVYDNLPKTEYQEGTEITLSNTLKGKLDFEDGIVGYGDTSQKSYQGYNLLPSVNTTRTINGITFTHNADGSITANGTASANALYPINVDDTSVTRNVPLAAESYVIVDSVGDYTNYFCQLSDGTNFANTGSGGAVGKSNIITLSSQANVSALVYIRSGVTINNVTFKPMVVTSSNIDKSYEPYVGGTASPNPSYPQDIEVVRGKNILNFSIVGKVPSVNGGGLVNVANGATTELIPIYGDDFILSYTSTGAKPYVFYYGDNNTFLGSANQVNSDYNISNSVYFPNTKYIRIRSDNYVQLNNNNTQLEKGSQATPYLPYNTIEEVVSGKNLLSSEFEQGAISSSGENSSSTTRIRSANYINVKPNTTYTISASESVSSFVFAYQEDNTFIATIDTGWKNLPYTFTTPNNCKKIRIVIRIDNSTTITPSDVTNIQLEQGSTATDYEPYITPTSYQLSLGDIQLNAIGDYKDELIYDVENDRVYKNEKIGKHTFNGSESWGISGSGTANWFYNTSNFNTDLLKAFNDGNSNAKSNYYISTSVVSSNTNEGFYIGGNSTTHLGFLRIRYGTEDTVSNFKTGLSTHNLIVYYLLYEPVEKPITDTTLINQVKALYNAHSNNGTTIITSNGELPMIIKVRGLKGE